MRPTEDVAADLELAPSDLQPWGPGVAKINPEVVFDNGPRHGKLVLVSAINPTSAGEGKTTCTIALTQAARLLGLRAACALREPSLGPVFGAKGGGTGGGRSRLVPAERINLHFTGDIHAVTAAHNLLASLVDNEVYFGAPSRLDVRQISIRRVTDINDRFLRRIVTGLGGRLMGIPREDGFDITAASEVMAILCLATDYIDLRARLGRMLVGFGPGAQPCAHGICVRKARWRHCCATPCSPTSCRRSKGRPHWFMEDLLATSRMAATASSRLVRCYNAPR
jgi:formate--tetrahydrofolate ligase